MRPRETDIDGTTSDNMIRILLAEDDDSMRVYLCRALERSGYEVVAVDRGTAALPLITQERFDLLLTDIVMPEMDGIELAQHVASIAPETRVMFITRLCRRDAARRPYRAGGQGALQAVPPARSRAGGRPHVRQEQRERAALISLA